MSNVVQSRSQARCSQWRSNLGTNALRMYTQELYVFTLQEVSFKRYLFVKDLSLVILNQKSNYKE